MKISIINTEKLEKILLGQIPDEIIPRDIRADLAVYLNMRLNQKDQEFEQGMSAKYGSNHLIVDKAFAIKETCDAFNVVVDDDENLTMLQQYVNEILEEGSSRPFEKFAAEKLEQEKAPRLVKNSLTKLIPDEVLPRIKKTQIAEFISMHLSGENPEFEDKLPEGCKVSKPGTLKRKFSKIQEEDFQLETDLDSTLKATWDELFKPYYEAEPRIKGIKQLYNKRRQLINKIWSDHREDFISYYNKKIQILSKYVNLLDEVKWLQDDDFESFAKAVAVSKFERELLHHKDLAGKIISG